LAGIVVIYLQSNPGGKEMSLITFKIIASIIIFTTAMLAGLLPIQVKHLHAGTRHIRDSITNGIFLGAAIFHMLPDAQAGFSGIGYRSYPYAVLLCFAGFILLQLIKYVTLYFRQSTDNSKFNGSIILVILCIHSIVEGTTLGINTTITNAFVIFIAIIAHKSCDSFALTNTLKRYVILPNHSLRVIFFYALMTPFGIVIASSVIRFFSNTMEIFVQSSLNALAAGTFIYIGALDTLIQHFRVQRLRQNFINFSAVLTGMGLMGFLAIWL
jgi:solute carrier family 39 (zinc transporter), member 1/2/3